VDKLLDETEAAVSVGVRQLCCREGTQARSFARGRENLTHAAQLTLGEELFRQVVESEGKAVLWAGESGQLELDWSGAQCVTLTPQGQTTTRLYASGDGVMVPTTTQAEQDQRRATVQKWRADTPRKRRGKLQRLPAVRKGSDQGYKQIYVTILHDQDQAHSLVGVTRKGVPGLERLLKRDGQRVGILEAKERVGNVDGAVCLKSTLEVLPLHATVLDFYHFGEHVGQAGVATLGKDAPGAAPPDSKTPGETPPDPKTRGATTADPKTPAFKEWLDKVLHTARHEGYAPFFQQLLEWRTPLRGGKRKAADALIGYVAPRQEMICYDPCDEKGWDVGSGPMESMGGVTTDRLKGRGRRWDIDNAEALMALEAQPFQGGVLSGPRSLLTCCLI
jgi:hypothetical protein